jgi:radical SAM modification target selenobiotic family peptide
MERKDLKKILAGLGIATLMSSGGAMVTPPAQAGSG